MIDEWADGHISMHKNPLYFRADEGLPHFDNLIVHFGTELGGILAAPVMWLFLLLMIWDHY